MTAPKTPGLARSAALAIHSELTICAAPHGGFAVYRPRHMQIGETGDDVLMFAGDIGSCMTFIVKAMVPPVASAAMAALHAVHPREPNAFARKLNDALRPISDEDGA